MEQANHVAYRHRGDHLTALGLQTRRDVRLQHAVLPLDRPDFDLQPRRVRLAPVCRQQGISTLKRYNRQMGASFVINIRGNIAAQEDLRIAGAVADDGGVLLDVEEVDGDVALQQDVIDGRLHLEAQVVRRIGLSSEDCVNFWADTVGTGCVIPRPAASAFHANRS